MNKTIFFKRELAAYENERIRKFAEFLRDNMDHKIYQIPSSTSGKYHAEYELGYGGLYGHLCAVTRFDNYFLEIDQYKEMFTSEKRDLIRLSAQFHDSRKTGDNSESIHTTPDHPTCGAKWVMAMNEQAGLPLTEDEIKFVYDCIESHSGQWCKDRSGNIILPVPNTLAQQLVHLADYLGSRKEVEVKFAEGEITKPEEPDTAITEYIMPFGKFKGELLCELPKDYLIWLQNNCELREPMKGYVEQLLS